MSEKQSKKRHRRQLKFAIFIPVYREQKEAFRNLKRLLMNNFEDFILTIAVDGEITPDIQEFLKKVEELPAAQEGKIIILLNNKRMGKVNTLNRAVKQILKIYKPEILVFFDNDVLIAKDREFLNKLSREMEETELLELPKEPLPKTFFGKIAGFDFIFASMVTHLLSRILKRSPVLNGAAFAIKTEAFLKLGMFPKVPYEDFELATMSYRLKMRFKMPLKLKVYNEPPANLKEWFNQKKRWAVEFVNWTSRFLFGKDVSHLGIFLDSMLVLYIIGTVLLIPSFMSLGTFGALSRSDILLQGISVFSLIFHTAFPAAWTFFTVYEVLLLLKGIITYLVALTVSTSMTFIYCKATKMKFNLPAYLIYYILYIPFAACVYIILITMDSLGIKARYDWKV